MTSILFCPVLSFRSKLVAESTLKRKDYINPYIGSHLRGSQNSENNRTIKASHFGIESGIKMNCYVLALMMTFVVVIVVILIVVTIDPVTMVT